MESRKRIRLQPTSKRRQMIGGMFRLAIGKDGQELQQEIAMAKPEILSGVRVLVVDDDSDAREILAVQLAHHGATTAVSASAVGALGELETFRPDVIVADIGMPGEDGYSLIRKVRN